MISVKVVGPGCPNCDRLERHARMATEQWRPEHPDVQVRVEKVTDMEQFLAYGLLSTPGLVIDERLVSSGRIPAPREILMWLEEALGT